MVSDHRREYMASYYPEYYKKNRTKITLYNMWNNCRRRALKRNIPCTITIDDISIPNECPILGIPLVQGTNVVCANSPTIDQIEIGKGYTPENIQVVSSLANRMKQNATLEQCVALGEWAAKQRRFST
jgi:hypothetical protein